MTETASPTGSEATPRAEVAAGTAPSTNRDRRRAERELTRALSTGRAIATWGAWIVFGHVCGFALLAGNGRLALVAGALALAFYVALCAHVEPMPARGPKGEIATMPEAEFERLVLSVERQSGEPAAADVQDSSGDGGHDDGFERLVGKALDELPEYLRDELERNVAVLVSDDGSDHGRYGCYGLYVGGTVANSGHGNRIVIFRDTLVRDFGDDPEILREQVTRTVRHELAHHLGAGERHVAELGLSDHRAGRPPRPHGGSVDRLPRGCRLTDRVRSESHPDAGSATARRITFTYGAGGRQAPSLAAGTRSGPDVRAEMRRSPSDRARPPPRTSLVATGGEHAS